MSDERQNVELGFLVEQSKLLLDEVKGIHRELAGVNGRLDRVEVAVAAVRTEQQLMRKDLEVVKDSVRIIEHDIGGIKMRVERIERHTGLVQA